LSHASKAMGGPELRMARAAGEGAFYISDLAVNSLVVPVAGCSASGGKACGMAILGGVGAMAELAGLVGMVMFPPAAILVVPTLIVNSPELTGILLDGIGAGWLAQYIDKGFDLVFKPISEGIFGVTTPEVEFYSQPRFRGARQRFMGLQNVREVTGSSVRSVRVPSEVYVELFRDTGWRGTPLGLPPGEYPDLAELGFSDVRSLRFMKIEGLKTQQAVQEALAEEASEKPEGMSDEEWQWRRAVRDRFIKRFSEAHAGRLNPSAGKLSSGQVIGAGVLLLLLALVVVKRRR